LTARRSDRRRRPRIDAALDLIERAGPRGAQLWFYLRRRDFDPLRGHSRFAALFAEADPN
jgi:hypothetical protein